MQFKVFWQRRSLYFAVNVLALCYNHFMSIRLFLLYSHVINSWNLLWQPNFCLQAYTGHNSPIMSLDFHPKKTDIFCFCDTDNEIQYWSVNPFSCTHVAKVGNILFCFPFGSCQYLSWIQFFLTIYPPVLDWYREVQHKWDFNQGLDICWQQHQIK